MRPTAWRSPFLWATGAILLLAGIARADSSASDSDSSIDFSQSSDGDDEVRTWTMSGFYGYETFRGISDGNWQNNGLNAGFNFGTRLGQFSDATGIGFQIGGSAGVYDWSGNDYRIRNNDQAETQGFITAGFFRKATEEQPWVMGLVFDWMINDNFSVFSETPSLTQWRYHFGYDVNEQNEIGVWGAVHGQSSTRVVDTVGPVKWQGIDQIDAFWHRKWEFGADTSVWIGAPFGQGLMDGGSPGSFIAGARGDMPLNNWMAIYSLVTYMRPAVGPGILGGEQDEWSFVIGLTFYPRRDSHTPTIANEGWAALMPVASNGTFFVDSDHNF